jgi:quercetin 2,3-dioxygenase
VSAVGIYPSVGHGVSSLKGLVAVLKAPAARWAGDGVPARNVLSYDQYGTELSPFLLIDYLGPHSFEAGARARGIGPHPHRGVEKVTLVYAGEVADCDTKGHSSTIGPGDVQWMTAGAGVVHQEFQSPSFAKRGGVLQMVQVWVNLPAVRKFAAPQYQEIKSGQIPTVELNDNAGCARIVAGSFNNHLGPARTHTPINIWDLELNNKKQVVISLPEEHTTLIVVLDGALSFDGAQVRDAEAALLSRSGRGVLLKTGRATKALVLTGAPIEEPIVGRGPFVMNSLAEVRQAFLEFGSGRF